MPRLVLARARSWTSGKYQFRGRVPVPVENEGDYHRLLRSGMVTDPDKRWMSVSPRKRLRQLSAGSEVLVVRDMGLGDVLMVSLVLRELARKWPELRFTFATSAPYVPLFRDCSFLERVISIFECTGDYPNTIELRGYSERAEGRHDVDRIDLFAKYCDVTVDDYSFPLEIRPDELEAGRRILGDPGPRGTMVVAVRGSTHVRTWPPALLFRFAEMAAADGWRVVVVDHELFPDVPKVPGVVNLTAQLSIGQLTCAIAAADVCIGPDTGVIHLAEAVRTRTLAIYSTTPPQLRVGHYEHVKAIWRRELPCAPCFDRGCADIPCLAGISPEIVLAAVGIWDSLPASFSPADVGRVAECTASV